MEQTGQKEKFEELIWGLILGERTKSFSGIVVGSQTGKPAEKINVVCLKWGVLYGPEYVNKILAGVQRHSSRPFDFYCMTENSTGLNEKIKIIPLLEDWKGWWGKATLFSKCIEAFLPSSFISDSV